MLYITLKNISGNYIYRGTKFNSRVETVKGERYLGTIPIRRFYIRCPKCVATITFKTDPENQVHSRSDKSSTIILWDNN